MMKYRTRICYSEEQKSQMWDRWQKGESLHSIARLFDRGHSSISRILSATGGIRPPKRTRSSLALSLSEREDISRGIAAALTIRAIAAQLSRSPSTVCREINRNGGYYHYRATHAEQAAWDRALRPKLCKLAGNKPLTRIIVKKLQLQWSPQQVAGWLKREYSGNEEYYVSHETIYKSLFIQSRGVLKKELLKTLRSSFIATLVERHSRYVMLAKVKDKDTESVVSALIKQSKKLPSELYKSLTWDRGTEMAGHRRFTLATDIDVYFCDPHSPWQRGSNENTNRLLRQYFPKGTDLALHSQAKLNAVARRLNERPRKTLEYETPAERFNACVASTV
jgi:IS30 family transposase